MVSSLSTPHETSLHAGRRYLVTGAASGMGREVAARLAASGARIAMADRDAAACRQAAAECTSGGGEAFAITADVTDEEQVAAMVSTAYDAWNGLDGAFNNAGAATHGSYRFGTPLTDVSVEAFRGMLEVNTLGAFLCLKHQLLALSGQVASLVVNASAAGLIGIRNGAPYVASKHGAVGLTKAAALEAAGTGIRINAVCPGFVETPMLLENSTAEGRRARASSTPMGRLASPGEVASLVCWLLSKESSFMTGAVIPVDGGLVAGPATATAPASTRHLGATEKPELELC